MAVHSPHRREPMVVDAEDLVPSEEPLPRGAVAEPVLESVASGAVYRETAKGTFARASKDDDAARGAVGLGAMRHFVASKELGRSVADVLAALVSAVFVFFQGALGGVSILVFWFAYVNADPGHAGFVAAFSPVAGVMQSFYYSFSTVALLGAIDKYAKDRMAGWYGRWYRQAIDAVVILCYAVVFIFTGIAAKMDTVLHYSNRRIPGWWTLTPITSAFASDLDTFHAINNIRIWGSILAWALLAFETHTHTFNGSNAEALRIKNSHAPSRRVAIADAAAASPSRTAAPASPLRSPQRPQ